MEKKRLLLETRILQMEKLSGKGKKSSAHKYDIKTSNRKKRRAQMQDIGHAFEIKR